MAAGKYSFTIEQGTTVDFEIAYTDSAGDPIDLTQHRARMHVRAGYGSAATLYATLSSSLYPDGTGLNLSGSNSSKPPTSGSIGLYISACTSSNFTFNEAFYDLEIVSGSGCNEYVTRLLEGKIKLSKEVTV
jgi:hypothetical protein